VTSNRIVAIPEFAAEVLRGRMAARGNSDIEQLVFSTKSGAPLNPSNIRRTFRQVIQLAGLSDRAVKLHSLRKTVATLISQHADEETAAHMLGHSGTQSLRQHYIERTRRPQPATAEILGRLAPHTLDFPRDDVADSA
jgi:integrase